MPPEAPPPVTDCGAEAFRLGRLEFTKIAWGAQEFGAAWQRYGQTCEASPEALCDEYLRVACLANATGAVETLELLYILPLRATLESRFRDQDLADEALQQLRQKLLLGPEPRLAAYRSTGHLRPWLQVVAIRLCQDLARQRGVRWARESPLTAEHSTASAVDVRLEKQELDALFVAALREVVQQLPTRERHALRMHVLAGWNVSQVGEALGIHRSSAARWIVSAKERINVEVRRLLEQRLDLTTHELDHLFTLFSTQFEVRLSHVFNTMADSNALAVNGK